jgi:hypothetical protein
MPFLEQSAPTVIARGLPLSEVCADENGIKPYVTACLYPGGAVAVSTFGRVNTDRGYFSVKADVTLNLEKLSGLIGIFGEYKSLTVKCENTSLKGKRILIQDILDDKSHDITDEVVFEDGKALIGGELLRKYGTMCQDDQSESGCVIKIGNTFEPIELQPAEIKVNKGYKKDLFMAKVAAAVHTRVMTKKRIKEKAAYDAGKKGNDTIKSDGFQR